MLRRLWENKLFVKAEKCSFHTDSVSFLGFVVQRGQLQADPEKVRAVSEWPVPTTRNQLQRFLGFANFYRRFIRDYSRVAAPLTQLTSTKVPFGWSQTAQSAFLRLKKLFSSAPVLCHPDPAVQFVVEVDASNSGVGAVLSQRSALDNKLHPCSFFSRRLSSAETNYDVGNRELLAVVLALQEWRHWLEGAAHPFIVWTDHRNLAYIQTARRPNSRQARWPLFLCLFVLPSPTVLIPRTARLTLSLASTTPRCCSRWRKGFSLPPVSSGQPDGRLSGWCWMPSKDYLPPRVALRVGCLFPRRPARPFSNGGTSPELSAIQGFSAVSLSSDSGFGGPLWLKKPRVSWLPVPSVPAANRHTVLRLVSCALYLFLTGRGRT